MKHTLHNINPQRPRQNLFTGGHLCLHATMEVWQEMGRENGGIEAVNDRSSWEQNQKGPAPEPIWDTPSNHPPDESCFTIYRHKLYK